MMTYAKGGLLPGKVDYTAEPGEKILPLKKLQRAMTIHKEQCDKWENEKGRILWTPKHSKNMTDFRLELIAHNIAWEDSTDEIMIRTRFWVGDGEESWSAICGKCSMGGTEGLIEVWNPADDEPSGGYTIDEIMDMIAKEKHMKKMMEKTRFIIGSLEGEAWRGKVYFFWRLETKHEPKIGDFAIVENKDTFALVEIIGIGDTAKRKEIIITGEAGGINKSVKYIVPRELLEGEKK